VPVMDTFLCDPRDGWAAFIHCLAFLHPSDATGDASVFADVRARSGLPDDAVEKIMTAAITVLELTGPDGVVHQTFLTVLGSVPARSYFPGSLSFAEQALRRFGPSFNADTAEEAYQFGQFRNSEPPYRVIQGTPIRVGPNPQFYVRPVPLRVSMQAFL